MAQLVEQWLPTPEVCSSKPVIGTFLIEHLFTVNSIEKPKIKEKKEKKPEMAHSKNG